MSKGRDGHAFFSNRYQSSLSSTYKSGGSAATAVAAAG